MKVRIKEQKSAADPQKSVWVSANAGSGKTSVLADRVVRLLRAGTQPGRILCLTFTRAAAGEMANRVFAQLSSWASADDEELTQELVALDGSLPTANDLKTARTLFARALETPGGLKIQTIHAFCERVLHQFPFEANVAAHFEVIDEGTSTELQEEAEREVLGKIVKNPNGTLGKALDVLMAYVGDTTFSGLMNAVIGARNDFLHWQQMAETEGGVKGLDAALIELADQMGLLLEETGDALEAQILDAAILNKSEWVRTTEILRSGIVTDQKLAVSLDNALAATSEDLVQRAYLEVFFTQAGKPRNKMMTKNLGQAHPELLEDLEREQMRLQGLRQKIRLRETYDSTHALLTFGDAVLTAYTRRKQRSGRLDYDDLIEKMRNLLTRQGAASWVLYKLDGGIDHFLVDEAQDTSPDQWEIIRLLSEEALSGEGAREVRRTIFAVGDEKQSIYSFQGAEPARFDEMRRYFARRVTDAQGKWDKVPLNLSFRSVPAILEAVDLVFQSEAARAGLCSDGDPVSHASYRKSQPGLVEIWPLAEAEPIAKPSPWLAPLDRFDPDSPRALLATRLAETIKTWIETKEPIAATGKPIQPGDILILVRRRDALVDALISALRGRNIQVAGADRLILQEHIAVMDLLAAADFVLLPEDDLNLAILLKSPLVGLSEEDLFALAHKRKGSIWRALESRRTKPEFAYAHELLIRWRGRADFTGVFGFFAEILGPDKGRANLHRRLGSEAIDAIDEFLNAVLRYEQVQTPSLQGFVHWMRAQSADIKRELEPDANEVRIMTVHGAKGLEAPIVFLPDTCSVPGARNNPKLTRVPPPAERPHLPDRLIWSPGPGANAPEIVVDAREQYLAAQREEYRRLLYVAMTRAKDRLYICGHRSKSNPPEDCWYELVTEALRATSTEIVDDEGLPTAWRFTGSVGEVGVTGTVLPEEYAEPEGIPLPGWTGKTVPPVASPPRLLTPSTGAAEAGYMPSRGTTYPDMDMDARQRGNLVHRLLQELASVSRQDRARVGERLLAVTAPELGQEQHQFLLGEAISVLEHPALSELFCETSMAEVPLAADLADPLDETRRVSVSAQIDRLAVLPESVLVADFKTDRQIPESTESVPPKYLAQMAAYAGLVKKIFPGKKVRTQLIWTAAPQIMDLSPELLAQVPWLGKPK